jgi:hypothetical protein
VYVGHCEGRRGSRSSETWAFRASYQLRVSCAWPENSAKASPEGFQSLIRSPTPSRAERVPSRLSCMQVSYSCRARRFLSGTMDKLKPLAVRSSPNCRQAIYLAPLLIETTSLAFKYFRPRQPSDTAGRFPFLDAGRVRSPPHLHVPTISTFTRKLPRTDNVSAMGAGSEDRACELACRRWECYVIPLHNSYHVLFAPEPVQWSQQLSLLFIRRIIRRF